MSEVKRTIRITTIQRVLKDVAPVQEGFPMRKWSIQISMLNSDGKEVPATIFDKVTYHLHPTFAQPVRAIKKPPFKIEEEGWGEFDLSIALTLVDRAGERKVAHDLNFLKEKYIVDHTISIPLTKPGLNKLLAETGPLPGDDASAGDKRKNGTPVDSSRTKKTKSVATKGGVDLEKLAEGLTKLNEDDLLGVVQMVNDNRTPEMNIKNDIEGGEFTMDLYTLPDQLLKSLFEYVTKRAQ
ncbi:unnamed protein product [Kuraishia capsulata CBS 1993]|uniref:YEATS domain-containing protein n=1 Tax=Kuraishia capsulata CBS 1993 TaxID=1382522 RepID=W6MNR8_9ASCO|nr:uncharacterized protein KUCA_T00004258001 [Kuraishia capsulata CBS 1993]CDK28276.1 unnamed protein product [Kuraishia capsulata CBS 1993]